MKNKKLLVICGIIAIVVIFLISKIVDSRYKVDLQKIENKDAKYFLLEKDNRYGVINESGEVLVSPTYSKVSIPDPRKAIFLCTENGEKWKALNEKNEVLYSEYNSVEAIDIESVSSNIPYEKSVLKYKSGNYYGLMSIDGKKITDAKYESIETVSFKEGYLKVKKDGAYGVISIKGVKLIDTEYDDIKSDSYYNDNSLYSKAGFILRTRTDDGYKYGYANEKGKIRLDQSYSEIHRIVNIKDDKNSYIVTVVKGRYGLIKNKKKVLNNEFDSIEYNEKNQILIVSKEGKKGVYNLDGKSIMPLDYSEIYVGGEYINAVKQGEELVFDKSGKKLDTRYTSYEKVANNKAIVINEDNKYNIVDNQNKELLSNGYIFIENYVDDLFIASREDSVGIINSNGNVVIPFEYEVIQKVEGANVLIAKKMKTNEVNIINKKGELVKGLQNADYIVKDNYIKIYSDNNQKYFTVDGEETTYQKLFSQNGVYASVENGKWGAVDSKGNVIVKYENEAVTELTNGVIGFKKDGKWGIYSKEGKIVLEPRYNLGNLEAEFIGKYYKISSPKSIPVYSGTER